MKGMRKILTSVLSAIALLIIGVVVFVDLFADRAVRIGIETAATKALNVGVDVNDVDLTLTKGKLVMRELVVNNPSGYQHKHMLDIERTKIYIETRSLLSDEVKIKSIKMEGVEVVLEQKGLSNNLQDVLKSIKQEPEEEAGGKKLHIDTLEIYGIKVKVKLLPVPGKVDTMTFELNPIKMTDLGSDKKLNTAALTAKIFVAIVGGVVEQGVGKLPEQMLKGMSSTIGMTLDLGMGIIEGGKSITEGILKGTGDAGKGVIKGIGGILNSGKDKNKE